MSLLTRIRRTPSWWIPAVLAVIVVVAVAVQVIMRGAAPAGPSATRSTGHSFASGASSFTRQVRAGQIDAVVVNEASRSIDVTTKGPVPEHYRVDYPSLDRLLGLLGERAGVRVTMKPPTAWLDAIVLLLPLAVAATLGAAMGYVLGRRRGRREATAGAGVTE
jgi:hypothetical protein